MKGRGKKRRNAASARPRSDQSGAGGIPQQRDGESVSEAYASPQAFEQALQSRLKQRASEPGSDLSRLRKHVAFDRFLQRVFARSEGSWSLKGGYAMEVRAGAGARSTKDVDLSTSLSSSEGLFSEIEAAASENLGDYFSYRVEPKRMPPGLEQAGTTHRFTVWSFIANKPFETFTLDVGVAEQQPEDYEYGEGRADLAFAGLRPAPMPMMPLADQFAEKLHAYTRPRENPTRVKDLIDLALMVGPLRGRMPSARALNDSVSKVFESRGSHSLALDLPEPPESWREPFSEQARALDLWTDDSALAHSNVVEYLTANNLFSGTG